jgi:hypothetical protein
MTKQLPGSEDLLEIIESDLPVLNRQNIKSVPVLKINGNYCAILQPTRKGDDLKLVGLSNMINTDGKKQDENIPEKITSKSIFESLTNDPLAMLFTGIGLTITTVILSLLLMPKSVHPYTSTVCKPDYFFMIKVSETCNTYTGVK